MKNKIIKKDLWFSRLTQSQKSRFFQFEGEKTHLSVQFQKTDLDILGSFKREEVTFYN